MEAIPQNRTAVESRQNRTAVGARQNRTAVESRQNRTAVGARQTIKEGTGVGSVISTGRNRRAGPVGVAGPLLAARWPLTPFPPQPPLPG